MSSTILEVLQNANYNLNENKVPNPISDMVGKDQLKNAVELLEKGYDVNDNFDSLILQYGEFENIPDKN
jgi:hypothetical protein